MSDTPEETVTTPTLGEAIMLAIKSSLSVSPIDVMADAYAILTVLDEKHESHAEGVQATLHTCWLSASGRIGATVRQRKVSDAILHEYFQHRGDWPTMKVCISQSMQHDSPERRREWEDKVAAAQQQTRHEFDILFNSKRASV